MKASFSILFAISLLVECAVLGIAQERSQAPSNGNEQKPPQVAMRDYRALVREVFAPITDQLNLTKDQEFQIIAIITATEVTSDPFVQKLDEVDQQLTAAFLIDSPDEATINGLSAQEAELLTHMISMKAHAKASIFQLLTPDQRMLVSHHFLGKSVMEGSLGSISIY
jgi:Spy/CpxP family protein refolding chaperone